jgi:polypeptide N-acetylgalactosaminyltransferase
MRVADVWMDEYKEYILLRRPHYRNIDPGDLTNQKAIREKLQCKSFKWFMTEVAFDLPNKYPPIEPPDFASGEVSPKLLLH